MTTLRRVHTTRPSIDVRDETPRAACADQPGPFDVLAHHISGPAHHAAVAEVTRMCGGCELRPECWREQRGEGWMESYAAGIGYSKTPRGEVA